MTDRANQPSYLPTPEEIERRCEEIRRRWSDEERQHRSHLWDDDPDHDAQQDDET